MIFIYGAGDRSKAIINLIKELKIKKKIILIDKKYNLRKKVFSEDYLLSKFNYKKDELIIGISNPTIKKNIYKNLKKKIRIRLIKPLISKSANLKGKLKIENGSIIMDNSFIGPNVRIGKNSFIGINTLVSHDTVINDFVEISHKVKIAGNVKINEGSFVGMSSIIIQKKKIGKNCFIGAGVLIKKNLKNWSKITLKQGVLIK